MSSSFATAEPTTKLPRTTIVSPIQTATARRRRFAANLAQSSAEGGDPLEAQDKVTQALREFLNADRVLLWLVTDVTRSESGPSVISEALGHNFAGMSLFGLGLERSDCEPLLSSALGAPTAVIVEAPAPFSNGQDSSFLAVQLSGTTGRCWLIALERLPVNARWSEGDRAFLDDLADLLLLAIERNFAMVNLLERSDQLDNVLRFSDLGILLIENVSGGPAITIANQRFCEFFGLNPETLIRQPWSVAAERLAPLLADSDNQRARLDQILANTEADLVDELMIPSSSPRVLNRYSTPARDVSGRAFGRIFFFRDITYDKELEKQLLHSQKMESIGTLAGGVAHDFNNLLTSMLGYAELLRRGLADRPELLARLDNIEKGARRAAELTGNLLAFSRRSPTLLKVFDLNRLTEETLNMIRSSIPHSIQIRFKLAPKPLPVEADETQIQQVIMNLILNARDAVNVETGNIVIITRTGIDAHLGAESPEYVVLEVDDDGLGIPTDSLHRVFEPFYTTKEVGKGTGLGLSMVYGIVKKHSGFIEVDSAPGLGSRFSIFLPPSKKQLDEVPADTKPPAQPDASDMTLMVVDDEEDLRDFCHLALSDFFKEVILAKDGQDALEIYQERGSEIDLVLLDLTMPRMSGAECFRRIRAINPDCRVVITSGYSLNTDGRQLLENGATAFLAKPYNLDQLTTTVTEAAKGNLGLIATPPRPRE